MLTYLFYNLGMIYIQNIKRYIDCLLVPPPIIYGTIQFRPGAYPRRFRPMVGTYGPLARKDLYRAMLARALDLGLLVFSSDLLIIIC